MNLKKYYGASGEYLKEHQSYFSKEQLRKDAGFVTSALKLRKKDKILDLACGHGRHTIELAKRGFDIDGLDFSGHLLNIAREDARQAHVHAQFFEQDIHRIHLKTKYDKIFMFFSEFGLFEAGTILHNVASMLKPNGLFLLDTDNVFRLIQYLIKHPHSRYKFDFLNMELKEKRKKSRGVRLYTAPELERLFIDSRLRPIAFYGNYEKEKLNIFSKRLILVGKK